MRKMLSVFSGILLTSFMAQASSSFNFNGRLINDNNQGEEGAAVFAVSVKVGSCEVYKESHSPNMTGSSGYFSLAIGAGSSKQGNIEDIFNRGNIASCIGGGGHVVAPADKVSISAEVSVNGQPKIAIQNQEIKAVPFAVDSNKLGGVDSDKFLQKLANVTEAKVKTLVDSLLSGTGLPIVYTKDEVDALISSGVGSIDLSGYATNTLSNVSDLPASKLTGTIDIARIPSLSSQYVTPSALSSALAPYSQSSSLSAVATSGSYNDLSGRPTLGALAVKASVTSGEVLSSGGGSVFSSASCSVNQSLYFSTVSDKLECQNIGGDLTVGSLKANKAITGAVGGFSSNTASFADGNVVTGSSNCSAAVALSGMQAGGVYTFVNTDAGTTMCTFSGSGISTWKFSPANAVRTVSTQTVYSFLVVGTTAYVSWSTGF